MTEEPGGWTEGYSLISLNIFLHISTLPFYYKNDTIEVITLSFHTEISQ